MEDMVRRRDVERTRFERKARSVREDHIPQAFCEADLDHLPRDVDPNDADSALLQRYRVSARAAPLVTDPLAADHIHKHLVERCLYTYSNSSRFVVDPG